MTATYTSPTTSDHMWIRDKIGDVDSDAFFLTDEEINSEITDQSNLYIAAAQCAYKIVTRMGEYKELAALFQQRGDTLMATAKRKRFSGVAVTLGQVRDVATYPSRLEHGEEQAIAWDING